MRPLCLRDGGVVWSGSGWVGGWVGVGGGEGREDTFEPLELARAVLVVVCLVKVGVVALAVEKVVLVRHHLEVVLERCQLLRIESRRCVAAGGLWQLGVRMRPRAWCIMKLVLKRLERSSMGITCLSRPASLIAPKTSLSTWWLTCGVRRAAVRAWGGGHGAGPQTPLSVWPRAWRGAHS